jgi:long-chain acyl-CoA synthetase
MSRISLFADTIKPCLLADAGQQVESSRWPEVFDFLDTFFERKSILPGTIVCLQLDNTVASVLILSYLLRHSIPVYLSPAQSLHKGILPSFCEKIIAHPQLLMLKGELQVHAEITDNPQYNHKSIVLKNSTGHLLLSTSGSTGKPKYVCYEYPQLHTNATNCVERFGLNKDSKILVPVPASHMFGLGVGVLPALLCGSSLRLVDKTSVLNLYDSLRRFEVDFCLVNPTLCGMLLKLNKSLQTGTCFISAGEKIKEKLADEFSKKFGQLVNLYGSTEMGAMATSVVASIPGKRKYLLNPLTAVSFRLSNGNKGEIYCRSLASFSFYLDEFGNRYEPLPFEDGWLSTGDMGLLHTNSLLEINGRIDWCINRSGFLVSLLELENKLESILGLGLNIILSESVDGQLVACLTGQSQDRIPDENALRKSLTGQLPGHLFPDKFLCISEIPLLPNGKPDRARIKELLN